MRKSKLSGRRNQTPFIDDHNLICDISGFKIRRSEAVKTWDNFMVRADFAEERHPQDFVRGVVEHQAVEDARPEQADNYLADNEVKASDL